MGVFRRARRGKKYQKLAILTLVASCVMTVLVISSQNEMSKSLPIFSTGRRLQTTAEGHPQAPTQYAPATHVTFNPFITDPPGAINPVPGAGGVFLWLVLTLWMFIGIAVVSDDYFVPSLEKISEALHLSDDVAGATFLAAGSSAPEFFTSVADTFFHENGGYGAGTIVGSAVFNILCIVAISCIPCGKTGFLQLDWYPLMRDATFYCSAIAVLILTSSDGVITWYEALFYVLAYGAYIFTMYISPRLRYGCYAFANYKKETQDNGSDLDIDGLHAPTTLMWTDRVETSLKSELVPVQYKLDAILGMLERERRGTGGEEAGAPHSSITVKDSVHHTISRSRASSRSSNVSFQSGDENRGLLAQGRYSSDYRDPRTPLSPHTSAQARENWQRSTHHVVQKLRVVKSIREASGVPLDVEDRHFANDPLLDNENDMEIPVPQMDVEDNSSNADDDGPGGWCDWDFPREGRWYEKLLFFIAFPWLVAFRFTIPNSERKGWEKWYPVSFGVCILWIGWISLLMVKFASFVGAILQINQTIMGVIVLAVGTSVPDALGSYNEAKRGHADAAVSNALGSNVFDILFGLGVPWLISTLRQQAHEIPVNKCGIIVPVIILFATLFAFLGVLFYFKFRLGAKVGYTFLAMYGVFLLWNILNVIFFKINTKHVEPGQPCLSGSTSPGTPSLPLMF